MVENILQRFFCVDFKKEYVRKSTYDDIWKKKNQSKNQSENQNWKVRKELIEMWFAIKLSGRKKYLRGMWIVYDDWIEIAELTFF